MAFKPIQILINAKDEASSVFDKLSTKIAAVGATVAGYFGIKSFVGAVQGAADLEAAISKVAAAADGGEAELQALRDAAEQAGRTTAFTAVEAAGSLENLVKAGLSAKDAIQALPAVMALSEAGGIELAQAADVVTKSIAGMGLAIEDAGRVADVLVKGANASNSSVEGLSQAFATAAPVAQSLGVSLEGTTAILGKMADAGIDASRAGTSLNNIMSQFSDPASTFRKELAAAGITTTNFEKALHQLAGAGAAGDKAIASVGLNAGPALRALLGQGMGALDELTGKLNNAAGSAAETAKVMESNLNGSITGLSSAWDTLKNVLMTPVLPVLKDGVDQLSTAFRSAVSSGVVEKFGKAIATGFQGAIEWARQFASSFDWDATAARLTQFAADAQTTLSQIGEYATNASNVVKTAWGVMGGGINTVLGLIYKLGEGFSVVAVGVQSGLANILAGLSKITFGGLSDAFKRAADEVRQSADATGAVAEAFAGKAQAAFDAAAEGARLAREGFTGLTGTIGAAGQAVGQAAASFTGLGAAAQDAGDKAAQAGAKAAKAADQQAQAAAAARAKVEELRAEYQKALDTGNLQRAAEVMRQLQAATQAAAASHKDLAREAKEAAALVTSAFAAAGIQTKQELATLANTARQQFELIKNSGQATTEGLATAWKRAADAAIAANGGIVPGWVSAQAAAHGYAVELGKLVDAHQNAGASGEAAGHRAAAGWRESAQAAAEAAEEAKKYDAYMASRFQQGWAQNADGNTVVAKEDEALRNQRIAALFGEDMIGNANAEAAYALKKRIDTLDKNSFGPGDGSLGLLRQELARLTAAVERDRAALQQPPAAGPDAPAGGTGRAGRSGSSGISYVSHITLGGRTTHIEFADRASQQATEDLLRRLSSDRRAAA